MLTRKLIKDIPTQKEREIADFDMGLLKRFLVYLKPHKVKLVFMYLFALINVVSTIAIPYMIKIGIDEYIIKKDFHGLLWVSAGLLGLIVILYISTRGQGVLVMLIGYHVLYSLRKDLLNHVEYLSFRFFDKQKTGQIMSRLTNDVQVLEELLQIGLDTLFVELIMLVGITVAMFSMDARLSLILFLTIPVFVLIVFVLRKKLVSVGRMIQGRLASVNAFLNESISGIKVIRTFAREKENIENFQAVNEEYYVQTKKFYTINAFFWQCVATMNPISIAMVLLAGGLLLSTGSITIGVIAAFLSYINRFFMPMQKISNMLNQVSRAMASAERIFEILDVPWDIKDKPDALTDINIKGAVTFRDVWFAYEGDEYAVKGLNFQAEAGKTIALVGATGAGKTTIVNLLCRFYDPIRGQVLIDGYDLRDIAQSAYRSNLSMVTQETRIFSGSFMENIRYGLPDATDDMVIHVAKEMGMHEMILSMPDGYNSEVGEQGANLSLGQKQLLAFARALIREPQILILDEASSYLDSKTEKLVQTAMKTLSQNRTCFVIAHRLATIQEADIILVVDKGKIVESGNHENLMSQNGHYARLVKSQYTLSA